MNLDDIEVGIVVKLNASDEKMTVVGFEKKLITRKDGSEVEAIAIICSCAGQPQSSYLPEALTLIDDDVIYNDKKSAGGKVTEAVAKVLGTTLWPYPKG
jgi:hypothetical protein